ncbi:MAG: hypothetical protein AAB677_02720 [Patescibacteria group bacterium]
MAKPPIDGSSKRLPPRDEKRAARRSVKRSLASLRGRGVSGDVNVKEARPEKIEAVKRKIMAGQEEKPAVVNATVDIIAELFG